MLLAKLLLVSGITMVLGLITVVGMFLVGQAVLGAYGIPVANLTDADAQRLVFGLGAITPLSQSSGSRSASSCGAPRAPSRRFSE